MTQRVAGSRATGAAKPKRDDPSEGFVSSIPRGAPEAALCNAVFGWGAGDKTAVVSHFDVNDGSATPCWDSR